MDINTRTKGGGTTFTEKICGVIHEADRPLQLKTILFLLKKKGVVVERKILSVYLSNLTADKILVKVKYPRIPGFYGKPDWIDKGTKLFKDELGFSPYFKN